MSSPHSPEPQPQPRQQKPRGYDQLSEEYKQMWDEIVREHPWFKRDKDGNAI